VQLPAAHRSLAARVIGQAVRDVRDPNGAPNDSASARSFLSGSPMLSYWCEIAELDLTWSTGHGRWWLAATLVVAAAAAPPKSTETPSEQKNLRFRSAPH